MRKSFLCKLVFVLVAFVFLTNSIVIYGANTTSMYQDDRNWKEKVDPYILEIMDDEDSIPVWLWMKDIDQAEVERKVFEKTGLTMNSLSVIDESISEELAVDIASLSIANEEEKKQVKKEFQEYLSRTKEERKIELQKTDKYIKELRSVQKEMLDEKTKDIINNLEIPDKNIVVSDTHAPVYIVNIETDDIERIASDPNIIAMYYYEEAEFVEETSQNDLSEVIAASTVSKIHEEIGLSGEGVSIGVLDGGFVQSSIYIPIERISFIPIQSSYSFSDHASFVARVAAGTDGVASDAYVYSSARSRVIVSDIPDYVDAGVNLINCSGRYLEETGAYSPYEIYLDYMIKTKKFTFVKSAGNSHGVITLPGLAYNCITVGGFFNQGTLEISDDEMYEWSNYINTVDGVEGCMKPELIADQSYDPSGSTGTSYAAPYVSGTIAMLYELRPSLKTQPDVVKAILMASCHRKVTPISGDLIETMS